MNKKHFFIVGAQRSGTTYLYTILDEHPEICMAKPIKPEPKYFLQKQININDYYKKYYKDCKKTTKVFGEKSTSYYESRQVAQRLANTFPMAKIIFILANPIHRAISNYKFSYENGLETRSLENALLSNDININYTTSVNPFAYKERGKYHKYLEYYYEFFPKENIKILIKENFIGNQLEIKELYNFLEVESNFIPKHKNDKINQTKTRLDISELNNIKKELYDYYQEYNQILKDKFNLNIKCWEQL